ncbi:LADA_0F14114g1_1 [Lachancea dasiensis]|uniref:LADA_0F14114g1_1 n=1 Tax=Lachancea dasiensis TaxID=1072105 RepID=A0A1G4JNA0_9SACH|nr:LADA_0F14114g1_1 [Lachancea dasiensis]
MPGLPFTDENAIPHDNAYRKDDGAYDPVQIATGLQSSFKGLPLGRRVALGDVTSQTNIPTHNKAQTGLYSRQLNIRDSPDRASSSQPTHPQVAKQAPQNAIGDILDDITEDRMEDYNESHGAAIPDGKIHGDADDKGEKDTATALAAAGAEAEIDIDENYNEVEGSETSSISSDSEPIVLVHTEESRRAILLAHQQLHSDAIDPLDEDTYDLVMVVEYAHEIFHYLHEIEKKFQAHPRYMQFQPELKWSYRSTLIDWIVQVHARFQLLPETLYLTVNIIDRFLSRKTVTLNRFQLVGAAALFLAAKFEEINCPSLKEILYMLDNSYSRDELLKAERYMINTLEFELGWPGPMSFLRRVSKADDYEYDIRTLAKYLLESTIMDSRLVSAQPSWLASGAYYLSRVILGFNDWSQQHIYYSKYTAEQLFPLATIILENCRHAPRRHQAIYEKYSERRHRRSSQVVARWIAMAEQQVT